ncbi:MAG: hypothetical protein CMP75_03695 [Flavobacteriales bacterium]|nr:hypothetical protein [Flavobacteriales bacterium]
MKKLISILSFFCLQTAVAQNSEIQEVEQLLTNYISPLPHALGAGLNNAWWTTAKPHKKLGFDVSLSITPIIIPDVDKSFSIGNEGSFSGGETATIFGGLNNKGDVNYNGSYICKMPSGLGIGFVTTPMLQAGIGLPLKTEVDFRYSPELKLKSFNLELIGVGVKHDLLQWIPVLNKVPIDLSVMAGHTRLNTGFDIQDQGINLNVKATTINLLLSKKVALLTAYAGVGYNHTSSNVAITLDEQNTSFLQSIENEANVDLSELATIEFENRTDLKANIGARVQLTLLTINASYTITQSGYKLYTAGIGVSLR